MKNNGRHRAGSNNRQHTNGNFSRSSAAAMKYYSYGTQAAKIEEAKDDVSLKYYGQLEKIERKVVLRGSAAKIFCALVVCFCAIIMIFGKSMAYNYQLGNLNLKNTLEAEKEATESLIANSTEKIDMAYVEQIATTRLNMTKPQSYQIVYIEVPKTDYTVILEAETVAEKEKPKITSYKNFVSDIKEAVGILLSTKTEES